MKLTIKTICVSAILVVCSGCANYAGGAKDSRISYTDAGSAPCEADAGKRAYRNPFLRARRIGQACTE